MTDPAMRNGANSIPLPRVEPERYAWRRRTWDREVVTLPPVPRRIPNLRMSSELMFLSFGLLSLVAAVFVVIERLNIVDGDWIGRDFALVLFAWEIAVGFTAVALCRVDLATSVARLLFL